MIYNTFGEYVSYLRQSRNYALRQFAEMIDISPFYLSSIENGRKSNPSVEILGRIYTVLKLSKSEMEHLLDLHAKANGTISLDIILYIMENERLCSLLRRERDKSSDDSWLNFISKILNE